MATTEEQLRTFLQDIAKNENYALSKIDIKPVSSDGANYTTDLFLATISEPPKPNLHIFAKTANLNEDTRKSNQFLARLYETEALFYSGLVVNFKRIYKKHQVPAEDRLNIPKYYGHVLIPYKEILVLENLETRGFTNFDRMKTFDWEYAVTAVTQLAKFHALGLAFRYKNPEEFEKITSNFDFDPNKDQETMNKFLKMSLENGCEGLNPDYKKRLLHYFSSKESLETSMRKMMQDKTMLIHGDFRPSNIMHRLRNGELEMILLDYQALRLGHPVYDLLYFIFSGSDEEFRRLHYERLFEHYFTQLTQALQHLNVDVEDVYPRKTFDANVIQMRPLGLCLALITVGMITVAPEDAPKMDGDICSLQVKPNKLAQERIRGIVKDFIRWGVI